MILKLRTGIDKHLSWRIVDYVGRVDYRHIDEPKEFGANDDYINVFPDVKEKRIVEVVIIYKNGQREMLWTDDAIFVLNDDGKTCDTINA